MDTSFYQKRLSGCLVSPHIRTGILQNTKTKIITSVMFHEEARKFFRYLHEHLWQLAGVLIQSAVQKCFSSEYVNTISKALV